MTAYLIAQVDVKDPEAYTLYTDRTPAVVESFGGRFIVRGGNPNVLEGALVGPRVVVIAFPDRETAERCYHSPEYQEIIPLRQAASSGALCIVDGAD